MGWTDENPSAGDIGRIRAVARSRQASADDVDGALGRLDTAAATASSDGWTGEAREKFLTLVAAPRPDLRRLARGMAHHAEHLSGYADTLEELQHTEQRLRDRRDELEGERFAAGYRLGMLTSPVSARAASSVSDDARDRAQERIDEAEAGLVELEVEWQELIEARRRADSTLVSHLGDTVAGVGRIDDLAVSSSSATGLLDELETMSPTDLAVLLELHPELADKLLKAPPGEVAAWWAGLARGAQRALISGMPAVIGNLGGVPYRIRDVANRAELATAIAEADAAGDVRRLESLEAIRKSLGERAGVPRQLIAFIDEGDPLAAVSVGDLDAADDVTFSIPGMSTTAENMPTWARGAQNLYAEQRAVAGDAPRAVVAWIGYDTPPVPFVGNLDLGVAQSGYARDGATRLVAELEGFTATRQDRSVNLYVVAHSYGTTTAAYALATTDLGVDAFVSLGSAGIDPAIALEDLHVDHAYAGQARDVIPLVEAGKGDEWAGIGRDLSGRANPISPGSGFIAFGVDGEPDDANQRPVTAHDPLMPYDATDGAGYFDDRTESLRNVALVTTGREADISEYVKPGLTMTERGYLTPGRGYGWTDLGQDGPR
ncbi:alpha/beta hydrolase [Agromyces lapidis]|uniref:Alpha/beta hydrolase n=1 Tax=Agromyces lapidis TaxID=279574 RepID=A0ABV5SN31_9MICO|nr:alpha/beta hydrolase [Agromyces lapidis]